MGDVDSVPLVAFVPVQPPEAVHDVASVLLQVSVTVPPDVIEFGEADRVTVGDGVEEPGDGVEVVGTGIGVVVVAFSALYGIADIGFEPTEKFPAASNALMT